MLLFGPKAACSRQEPKHPSDASVSQQPSRGRASPQLPFLGVSRHPPLGGVGKDSSSNRPNQREALSFSQSGNARRKRRTTLIHHFGRSSFTKQHFVSFIGIRVVSLPRLLFRLESSSAFLSRLCLVISAEWVLLLASTSRLFSSSACLPLPTKQSRSRPCLFCPFGSLVLSPNNHSQPQKTSLCSSVLLSHKSRPCLDGAVAVPCCLRLDPSSSRLSSPNRRDSLSLGLLIFWAIPLAGSCPPPRRKEGCDLDAHRSTASLFLPSGL